MKNDYTYLLWPTMLCTKFYTIMYFVKVQNTMKFFQLRKKNSEIIIREKNIVVNSYLIFLGIFGTYIMYLSDF